MKRDLVLMGAGTTIAACGVVGSLVWGPAAGLVAILAMAMLILTVQVLQRRQTAILQQRVLSVIKLIKRNEKMAQETIFRQLQNAKSAPAVSDQALALSTKRIIGLLQAQQIGLEQLHQSVKAKDEK